MEDGATDGASVGNVLGSEEGMDKRIQDGTSREGEILGNDDGLVDGATDGASVVNELSSEEGMDDGIQDGTAVGSSLG